MTESTIQWILYKRLKLGIDGQNGISQWLGMLGSAGSAKFVAIVITYPRKVFLSPSVSESTFTDLILIGDSGSTSTTKY